MLVTESEFLTVAEVAERIRVGPETVRRWLRAKKLHGKSFGRGQTGWRIDKAEVERFLAERER